MSDINRELKIVFIDGSELRHLITEDMRDRAIDFIMKLQTHPDVDFDSVAGLMIRKSEIRLATIIVEDNQ